jgi:hypothetical protein
MNFEYSETNANGMVIADSTRYCWANSSNVFTTPATGFSRASDGTVNLGNCSNSTDKSGTLNLAAINVGGTAVLPTINVGAVALPTAAIAAGACSSTITATATGATSAMVIEVTPTVDMTTVTGYTAGALNMSDRWLTAGQFNMKVCNSTAASITPGALTINVRVVQ